MHSAYTNGRTILWWLARSLSIFFHSIRNYNQSCWVVCFLSFWNVYRFKWFSWVCVIHTQEIISKIDSYSWGYVDKHFVLSFLNFGFQKVQLIMLETIFVFEKLIFKIKMGIQWIKYGNGVDCRGYLAGAWTPRVFSLKNTLLERVELASSHVQPHCPCWGSLFIFDFNYFQTAPALPTLLGWNSAPMYLNLFAEFSKRFFFAQKKSICFAISICFDWRKIASFTRFVWSQMIWYLLIDGVRSFYRSTPEAFY